MRGARLVRLGAVTLLLLVAACGEGEDSLSPFCREVAETHDDFVEDGDEAGFVAALEELDEEPPEEIAESWDLVLARWDELADPEALEADDPADLDAAEAVLESREELRLAWGIVGSYLRDACGMAGIELAGGASTSARPGGSE
jgi:hypothetical protein